MWRRWRVGAVIAATSALGVAVIIAGGLLAGTALGSLRVVPILSGSMAPALPTGALAFAVPEAPAKLEPGAIVVFRRPLADREVVAHRVASAAPSPGGVIVESKGDANDSADPWRVVLRGDQVWVVKGSVPYVGYAAVFARRWWILLAALAFAALVVPSLVVRVLTGGGDDSEASCPPHAAHSS